MAGVIKNNILPDARYKFSLQTYIKMTILVAAGLAPAMHPEL